MQTMKCSFIALAGFLILQSNANVVRRAKRSYQSRLLNVVAPEQRSFDLDLDGVTTYPSTYPNNFAEQQHTNYPMPLWVFKKSGSRSTEGRFFKHNRERQEPTIIVVPLAGNGFGFGMPFNFTNINNNTLNAVPPAAAAGVAADFPNFARLQNTPANSGNIHLLFNTPGQVQPQQHYENPYQFAAPQSYESADEPLYITPQQLQSHLSGGYGTRQRLRNNLRYQIMQLANKLQYV